MNAVSKFALILAAWTIVPGAWAQATSGAGKSPATMDDIESALQHADTLAERRKLVHTYLEAAARDRADQALTGEDRRRIQDLTEEARRLGAAVVPLVGRYNILLCPQPIATVADERHYVALLDASYVLLRRLFDFDPVAAKGYRIIHRYDAGSEHGAHSNWRRLDCWYGTKEWEAWVGAPCEWTGNPIHEMTHCFAGNSPGRIAIESLPGSGEGWPKWTPLYVYQHLPDQPVFYKTIESCRRQYTDALEANFRENGRDFWSIGPYDPAGGLLILLGEAAAGEDSADPFAPFARMFSELNAKQDRWLEEHAPLELLRFVAALDAQAAPKFWSVLERYQANIHQSDVKTYRLWSETIGPRIRALNAAAKNALQSEVDALVAQCEKLGAATPLSQDLREQALAALASRLHELGQVEPARAIFKNRRFSLNWELLGPFKTASADTGMQTSFIDETSPSRTALHAAAGKSHGPKTWQTIPYGDFSAAYELGPLFGEHTGDAGYALTTYKALQAMRVWAFVSADDRCRVWLNGRPVGSVIEGGINRNTRDRIVLDLKAGENTILVKIVNNGGPWGFYFRLTPDLSPKK